VILNLQWLPQLRSKSQHIHGTLARLLFLGLFCNAAEKGKSRWRKFSSGTGFQDRLFSGGILTATAGSIFSSRLAALAFTGSPVFAAGTNAFAIFSTCTAAFVAAGASCFSGRERAPARA
jgi:hypothetical protein